MHCVGLVCVRERGVASNKCRENEICTMSANIQYAFVKQIVGGDSPS